MTATRKGKGATADFRPWSAADNATLRELFPKVEAADVARQLGRTRGAVFHQAARLGLKKNLLWTKDHDIDLRWLWESGLSVTAIARRLSRTPLTTYWRARKLGLRCGCPEGFEYLNAAAERTGYERSTLTNILTWAGVTTHRSMARPTKAAAYRFRIVDPMDVDDAIARWHETEPLETAARRVGVEAELLRRRLRAAGVPEERRAPKAHWRVRQEDVERALQLGRGAAAVAA